MAASIEGPGTVRNYAELPSWIGEMEGGLSHRAESVAALLSGHGLPTAPSENIRHDIWKKLMANIGLSAPSAIADLDIGQLFQLPEMRETIYAAIDEAVQVAQADGFDFDSSEARSVLEKIVGPGGSSRNKSSLCVDLLNRRRTEIDYINGAVVRCGRIHGIPTPVNATLVAAVKALESHFQDRKDGTWTGGIRWADFHVPLLPEIAVAVASGLKSNFRMVDVSVAACPDMRRAGCAFAGLGGDPFLVEIGGEPLVHNPAHRHRGDFDLVDLISACGRSDGRILGAGFPSLSATEGKCGELIPCLELAGGNLSRIARVGDDRECIVENYPFLLHGGLGNLYVCDGDPGEVIRIEARHRTGDEASFTQAIRAALNPLCTQGEVALGGVFSVLRGRIRAHISPDFECIPFPYYDAASEQVFRNDFLQFYDGMGPELLCMAVLWTGDPEAGELHLRPTGEHTHFFSTAGRAEAGHYHHDVTPGEIHYLGYFHPAGRVARIADIYAELELLPG